MDHYKFTLSLIESAYELKQLDELNYHQLLLMLIDADVEDFKKIKIVNIDLIGAIADHKRQKISERLVIGAEKIEETDDPKEKARLMVHYNNLLKELGA